MGYTPLKLTTEYYLLKIGRKWSQKKISSSNHWRSGAFAVDFREGKLPKTNSSPLKIGHPKKATIVFQPSIFRCEITLSFREGSGLGWDQILVLFHETVHRD